MICDVAGIQLEAMPREVRDDIYETLMQLDCVLMCWRRLRTSLREELINRRSSGRRGITRDHVQSQSINFPRQLRVPYMRTYGIRNIAHPGARILPAFGTHDS